MAEVDRRRVHASRAALVPAHQVRSRRLDRGEVTDQHRVARGERGGGRAEVRDGVEQATQRRGIADRRRGHRFERSGLAVVAEDVAGDGAQFVAQPAGEREQQVLGPQPGLRLVGEDAIGQGVAQLVVSRPRRSSESSRAAWRAMNSAKVTLAPVKARGALDSTSSRTALFRPSTASGTARTAASPRWRSVSASDRSSRLVDPRSAMTSRRPVCSTSRTVGSGLSGRPSSSEGAPTPLRLRAVRTVNTSSPSGREILHSVTPTPSAATRARASSGARRSPATCGAGAMRAASRPRGRGGRILGAQQRLDVGAPVAAMSARTAVAGQLAGVAPAAQRVEADAKLRRRFAEAEPAIAVRSSYAHTGGEVEVAGRSEVHQF